MLTRIYGLAFETKEELEQFLHNQEEAKKRDHRKLGKELKLFTISDLVGAGLPMLQPNGMIIRKMIEDYLWDLHKNRGYQRVWTPHITKKELYETSGHAAKFGEEIFHVKGGDEEFFMKPMNCPHHMQIFADNQFSYRNMPVRYFEPATVYRYEKAGQLAGLTRVRAITQDDGHLFCRVSQIGEEVSTIVSIIKEFYTTMNMLQGYWVRFSIRGEDKSKYLGGDEVWEKAETALEQAAKDNNLNYKVGVGEAAFYGPKIDVQVWSVIGREFTLATNQVDFAVPKRFGLVYRDRDNTDKTPLCIHRAPLGTHERFIGFLIEHYAGNFPLWLAPDQVRVLTIGDDAKLVEYGQAIVNELRAAQIRAEGDFGTDNIKGKVLRAEETRAHTMLVIGPRDLESGQVSVRLHGKGHQGAKPRGEVIADILQSIRERRGN